MAKFKIDLERKEGEKQRNIYFAISVEAHQWIKVMAAIHGLSIPNIINQTIEYAKNNSERVII